MNIILQMCIYSLLLPNYQTKRYLKYIKIIYECTPIDVPHIDYIFKLKLVFFNSSQITTTL